MLTALTRSSVFVPIVLLFVGLGFLPSALAQRPATHPSLHDAALPPLIPAEAFFADQSRSWNYRVSPDGRRLVWIAYVDGKPTLHLRELDGSAPRIIEAEKPVYRAYWAYDNRHLVFYWDNDGDENYHLYTLDTAEPTPVPRNRTPLEGATVWWHQGFREEPTRALVRLNDRDPSLHDLFELDLASGGLRRLAETDERGQGWMTDREGNIIARFRRLGEGRRGLQVPTEDGGWRLLIDWEFDESFWGQGRPPAGAKSVWAMSNRGRDRIALVQLDLETGVETLVHEHPRVDLSGVWIDYDSYAPLSATAWPDYREVEYFDQALGEDLALFQLDGPASVRIESNSLDKQVMTLQVETDRTSQAYYLFDRRTKARTLLAEAPIAQRRAHLAESRPVSFQARDGLALHGYLVLPVGVEARNLPMVLRVHGGPWARDFWGYSPVDQFLANRGYAVLRVNYRGSSGYGRSFLRASRREFAGKMHDDLIDGVNWAIEQGIADPDKIAIYGRSYGGYATMVGLTFTPEVFAAGINIVGVTDLVMALETFPPYWKPWRERWLEYVGDADDPADRADMAARSPINFVDRIKRPLLMVQGANDVRVVRAHSDRIADAMEKAGLPFEYIVFDDEGHAIRKWQNQLTVARAGEQFLADHLGGRASAPVAAE